MEGLAKLAGTSYTTISNRIKNISSNGIEVNYINKITQKNIAESYKTSKPRNKIKDDYLITLVNENPELNMKELAKITGISCTTISNRIKKIARSGVKINYINTHQQKSTIEPYKESKPKPKLTDEYFMNLINENPDLNMDELAKLAGTSCATISRRVKKFNAGGENANYIKKNSNRKSKLSDKSSLPCVDGPN
jgi:DNA-binding Lrp family transcriptional regulator